MYITPGKVPVNSASAGVRWAEIFPASAIQHSATHVKSPSPAKAGANCNAAIAALTWPPALAGKDLFLAPQQCGERRAFQLI